ncbi:diacylglycerol/polyprenol kinase family protein [Prochlorococcus marinus]|uniref:Dolichol kinase n=1 Tax=Prochlorococcus marinus XMU1408 TaxID=2213228 RepID=A0A318R027_PROMR|nr:dolichol kinase [Prochlorococcus marinus]MBW3042957.1 dolichol kinase [Prochlorococcus marinus str. XMU1408]PYE00309.1 dolichol kinase [Prochlorococcus marinus XMU1408]
MPIQIAIFVIALWIITILVIAFLCKRFFPKKEELSRKIIHIGTGPVILLAWLFDIPKNIAFFSAFLVTIALGINYQYRLLPAIEDIERKSFGTIAYGISITLLLLFFWPNYSASISIGVLSMAFGDGLAGLIGRSINSPNWTVLGQTKSIAGTLTMGSIVAMTSATISSINNLGIQPLEIIVISLIATFLEQISPWGIDNITVPIGVTCVGIWLVGT